MRPSDAPDEVVRVRTRETILRADVCNLIVCAVEAVRYPGVAPGDFYHEIVRRVAEPHLGVFVGYVATRPEALIVTLLPTSTLMGMPQVCIAYNEGSPALFRELTRRMRQWIVASGFRRAFAINPSRDDRTFMVGLAHFGKPARLGSLIEFDLT